MTVFYRFAKYLNLSFRVRVSLVFREGLDLKVSGLSGRAYLIPVKYKIDFSQ